jgi:hypothetical protein
LTNPYTFQTSHFAIDSTSIHLLRNHFPYKTISLSEIKSIDIKKGKDIKNWWWVLAIGLALTLYALWDVTQIFGILQDKNTFKIEVERLVLPAIPLMLGLYSLYIASRNSKIMIIKTIDRSYYLSLRDLIKQQQYDPFISLLQSKFPGVNIIY